ncbi:MAG: hypothetical protein RIS84_90 [Pseudomonadota bacterium]|jgi:ATP-binding cassette subfamily F protein 3
MIYINNLSLQRGTKVLFANANLTLYAHQKVGFIGANGSGKSSLFALFRNELHLDQGSLELPPKLVIAHVAQETPPVAMSALDYVLDGDRELRSIEAELLQAQAADDGMWEARLHAEFDAIGGYTARARAAQLLDGLSFAPHEQEKAVNTFSGGWRMRLNLAQALMCRSDLLLLDEPTNHLDLDAVLWLEQWLSRYQGTLLLISHDRDFLDTVIDSIVHVYDKQLTFYSGNYEAFERQRAANLALQQSAYDRQQREIAHIHSFVERFRYKASKAKQAQSRIKALERMELIAAAHADSPFQFSFPEPVSTPTCLLDLDKCDIGYGENVILKQVSFSIGCGARIGLLGANGAGKSTLIKLLSGQLQPLTGKLSEGKDLRIGYFAQHQLEQLRPDDSAFKHVQLLDPLATEQAVRNFLGGFGFVGDKALESIAPFSGGEKARLALALLVWQRPNLLLLDEPTNHLDLDMRDALSMALQDYVGAMVLVSHDRHLVRSTTDQLWLVAQGVVKPFEGDLDDYRQWLLNYRAEQRSEQRGEPPVNKQLKKQQDAQQREQRKVLQNRLKQLDKELEKLGIEKKSLETFLANPDNYHDQKKLHNTMQRQTEVTTQLAHVEETWLEVTETLEHLNSAACS